jgi:streptogramin lyase/thiol-disulfide isomerase/thioredoxin
MKIRESTMKDLKMAALAAIAFAFAQFAAAQTPPQSCKYATRVAHGQDVAIVRASDGSLWYASQSANRIVRVDPKGVETPFVPVDGSTKGLSGMVLDGKGNVWFSKRGGGTGIIGRFPEAGGEGIEFALPERHAFPDGLVIGPDNQIWYFDPVQHKIGRINADGGSEAFEGPLKLNPGITPTDMATGPDNSLWITDLGENSLFKFDVSSKAWKRYDIPEPQAHPKHVRVAKDGTVWFSMVARNKLGRFKNGAFTTIDIQNENPNGLHVAEDQSLWYTTTNSTLGRIKPDGTREKYRCNNVVGPMTTAPDGTVYALGSPNLMILKPGDTVSAPKVASTSNVQGPSMMPLGPSPVKEVTLPELRKLFDDKSKKLVVHYNVLPRKGCGPCDESVAVFEEFARKNAGKATFVRVANEYTETAWSDPWYKANASLTGVPTYIAYVDQKELARVVGRESVPLLESRLLAVK